MTVRLRIALTIALTGLVAVLGVVLTVALTFQRFEHESTYERANAFIGRVVEAHGDLLDVHARDPEGFGAFLRNVLLAIGNSGEPALLSAVRPWFDHADPTVRGAAAWAFRRLARAGKGG